MDEYYANCNAILRDCRGLAHVSEPHLRTAILAVLNRHAPLPEFIKPEWASAPFQETRAGLMNEIDDAKGRILEIDQCIRILYGQSESKSEPQALPVHDPLPVLIQEVQGLGHAIDEINQRITEVSRRMQLWIEHETGATAHGVTCKKVIHDPDDLYGHAENDDRPFQWPSNPQWFCGRCHAPIEKPIDL